jgi:hypothetical protein
VVLEMLIEGLTVIRIFSVNFHRRVINTLMLFLSANSLRSNNCAHSRSGIIARGGILCYQSLSVLQ